jgi:hypothetical protein
VLGFLRLLLPCSIVGINEEMCDSSGDESIIPVIDLEKYWTGTTEDRNEVTVPPIYHLSTPISGLCAGC